MRFMVLKTTGLSSRSQRKNRFWKICTGSQDIKQNVPKSGSPNQTCIFWDVLANISGPVAYFSKPIFALKPWAQAGCFEYHEPYKRNKFFFSYKGGCQYQRGPGPSLPILGLIWFFSSSLLCWIVTRKNAVYISFCAWPYKGRASVLTPVAFILFSALNCAGTNQNP